MSEPNLPIARGPEATLSGFFMSYRAISGCVHRVGIRPGRVQEVRSSNLAALSEAGSAFCVVKIMTTNKAGNI